MNYTHGTITRVGSYSPGNGYYYFMYVEEFDDDWEYSYFLDTRDPPPTVVG